MPKEAKLTFLYKIDNCDSDVTKVNFKTSHFQQKKIPGTVTESVQ